MNQPAGKVLRVGHWGKAGRLGTFLQPLRVALRGQIRGEVQQAKAVNRHQPADPLRANAGVHHRHHATHAVPHQPDRGLRAVVRQQRVQVGQVVRKIIAAGIPGAQAKAAPVRGQHMPVAAEGVHHKLESGRSVHPAVQHPEFGRIVPAPVAHMVGVATDGQGFRARYKMRGIHGGDCNGCCDSRHQGNDLSQQMVKRLAGSRTPPHARTGKNPLPNPITPPIMRISFGEMPERLNGPDSKSVGDASPTRVRIPISPPDTSKRP